MKDGNGKRKQWSSAEKLRIVLAGLQAETKPVVFTVTFMEG